jgi:hypothetical protein
VIHICVPIKKRYDLFRRQLVSLRASSMSYDVHVINNGDETVPGDEHVVSILKPTPALSVAASWNWFINHVPQERLITNDDVMFGRDTLEKMHYTPADLVMAEGCGFSCFIIRDSCISKIGLFDESISPGYGYYEDEDYLQRIDGRGTREPSVIMRNVAADVVHLKSQTLEVSSPSELHEHHRRFRIAQRNYAKKWHLEAEFGIFP